MRFLVVVFLFIIYGCMAPVNHDPFAGLFEPEPEIVYQPPLLELPAPLITFRTWAEPWPYYGYGIYHRDYHYGYYRHWRHHHHYNHHW